MQPWSNARRAAAVVLTGLALAAPAHADPTSENFDFTNGFQSYTVPVSGTYAITGYGAAGGLSVASYESWGFTGSQGAEAAGDFNLTAGETLAIAVGGAGDFGYFGGGGGGGGSFVIASDGGVLLVAGGGGGGADSSGGPGHAGPDGTTPNLGGAGGSNGGGGDFWDAGGGGGVNGDGGSGVGGGGLGLPMLTGGIGGSYGGMGFGGFGGGGGGGTFSGGGGGGYSGGGGGEWYGGGGGGSFLDPTASDAVIVAGVRAGAGAVEIALLEAEAIPEPGSITVLAALLGLLTAARRSARATGRRGATAGSPAIRSRSR